MLTSEGRMGSGYVDDEMLVQMVQDFIESDSSSSDGDGGCYGSLFTSSTASDNYRHHSNYLALRDILERAEAREEAEVLASVMKLMRRRRRMRKLQESSNSTCRICHASSSTALKKWLVFGLQMEGYIASMCQTSWVTSLGCPGGDYEYIDVMICEGTSDGHGCRLIVDIDFKSQFEVARPTRKYKELMDILPSVFVGNESKLNNVISILCSAAKQSLRERGLHVPPWRTAAYMQSKWLSPVPSVGCNRWSQSPTPPSAAPFLDCCNLNNDNEAIKSNMIIWG